jgi:putative phosphoesterase
MTKIGIMTDIHNNIVALNSILKVFENENCSEIICCGDIIGIGPFPEETVMKVKSIKNLRCVLGNHETYLLNGLKAPYPDCMAEDEAMHHLWEHGQLSEEGKKFISQLPYKLYLERDGFKIAVMHYCLNGDNKYINYTQNPTADDCDLMFSDVDADIIVYGHNHETIVNKGKEKFYINCGSLGCPHKFEGLAKGGILSIQNGKFEYHSVSATYNLQVVADKADEINYPAKDIIKQIFYGVNKKTI